MTSPVLSREPGQPWIPFGCLRLTNALLHSRADSRVLLAPCEKPPGRRNTFVWHVTGNNRIVSDAQSPISAGSGRGGVNKALCAWLSEIYCKMPSWVQVKLYPCIFHGALGGRVVGTQLSIGSSIRKSMVLRKTWHFLRKTFP